MAIDRRRLKFVALGTGVALSMAFLLIVGVNRPDGFVYYLTVSEFVQQPRPADEGFRVNGKVVAGTIVRQATGQDVRFVMSDGVSSLSVEYHGIVPDTFVDLADVVVEGRMREDGVFEATELLAKCPSKYESAEEPASMTTAAAGPPD